MNITRMINKQTPDIEQQRVCVCVCVPVIKLSESRNSFETTAANTNSKKEMEPIIT